MSLKERISEDMKAALKARQRERLSAIRLLMAAIQQKEIDERKPLDDAAVIAVTERLIKQRRDSIEQFQAAGRTDLVDKETAELELLKQYLPQPLSQEEVASAIEAAIAATGASGPQAMGKVMAALKAQLAGRADMTRVSALVKARLGS
ncbi:MAG: GatB/YqeY domain-containing protein [Betaproteobacteria bacterium]|nr:MAG: GatB/YqeY domain-containing protein [Betaproteobacteria bacterium]